jgi:hypothetical protein
MVIGERPQQPLGQVRQAPVVAPAPEMHLGKRMQVGVHAEPVRRAHLRGCVEGPCFRLGGLAGAVVDQAVRVVGGAIGVGCPERRVVAIEVNAQQMVVGGQEVVVRTASHVLPPHPAVPRRFSRVVGIGPEPITRRIALRLQETVHVEYRNDHDVGVVAQVTHQVVVVRRQGDPFDDPGCHLR